MPLHPSPHPEIPISWRFFQHQSLPQHFIGDVAALSRKSDHIRAVSVPGVSSEYCCGGFFVAHSRTGQHVANTAAVFPFIVTGVQSVAAGIKRIEAKAGPTAVQELLAQRQLLREVTRVAGCGEKELVKTVEATKKVAEALTSVNATLMRAAVESCSPTFSIEAGEG